MAVVVGPGEEVLVGVRHFGERVGQARVAFAAGLVVVDEGFQEPVGARGPHVQGVLAAEVVDVAGLPVGVRGGDDSAGAEDGPGVVAPVGQLALDQGGMGPGDLGERGCGGRRGPEVEVGVGGERPGPGGVPVPGPQAGQPRGHHPGGGQQVVAAGGEEPFQERRALRAPDQLRGGEGAFGGVGAESEGGAEVGGAVEGGVAGEEVGVRVVVLGVRQEFPQRAGLGEGVRLPGAPPYPREEKQRAGAVDS